MGGHAGIGDGGEEWESFHIHAAQPAISKTGKVHASDRPRIQPLPKGKPFLLSSNPKSAQSRNCLQTARNWQTCAVTVQIKCLSYAEILTGFVGAKVRPVLFRNR